MTKTRFCVLFVLAFCIGWIIGSLAWSAKAGPVATFEVELYNVSPFTLSLDYGEARAMILGPVHFYDVTFVMPFDAAGLEAPELPRFVAGTAMSAQGLLLDLTLDFEHSLSAFAIYDPVRTYFLRDPIVGVVQIAPEPAGLVLIALIIGYVCGWKPWRRPT